MTDKQGNEWKVVKSVGSVFGTTLNSKELSLALKNEIFHPNGGIILHLKTGKPYQVNFVFKCSDCEKIHLSHLPSDISSEEKKETFGKDIIYLDRTDSYVAIEDLISLLDNFKDAQDIGTDTFYGEDLDIKSGTFTCTQVLKCPHDKCENAHLSCHYE